MHFLFSVGARYKEIYRLLDSGMPNKIDAGVGKALMELAAIIRDFNLTTTKLTKNANKLILFYVILTAVIAFSAIIALFLK